MSAVIVLRQMLRDRTRSTIWWSVAMIALVVAVGASYPTIKASAGGLEDLMESMPEGLGELLGAAGGITSPVGYLNSQFYSNMFPILLLVFGIGIAGWSVAGAEREGTLEPLLANPVRRSRVALGRYAGLVLLLAVVVVVTTLVLIAFRGPFQLSEISVANLVAAGVASFLLALLFATITYAVGAATGRKGLAAALGGGLAAATYVVFGLGSFVSALESVRWLSPWYWFLEPSPLVDGWTLASIALPLLVIVPAVALGTVWFTRRDLR